MNKHVTNEVLKWLEGTSPHHKRIEDHLAECSSCRKYYEWMAESLQPAPEKTDLTPDYYLPSRIAALAAEHHPKERLHHALRWSLSSLALAASITIGILLGKGLSESSTTVTTEDLISTYHSALAQQNFSAALDSVLQVPQGGKP